MKSNRLIDSHNNTIRNSYLLSCPNESLIKQKAKSINNFMVSDQHDISLKTIKPKTSMNLKSSMVIIMKKRHFSS